MNNHTETYRDAHTPSLSVEMFTRGLKYENNVYARSQSLKKKKKKRLPISGKLRTKIFFGRVCILVSCISHKINKSDS